MKKIVITGHTKGIGKKISNHLNSKGFKIFGISRSSIKNIKFSQFKADITDLSALNNIFKKINKFDVLINNASISNFSEKKFENFRKIIEINLIGTYNCCEVARKYLKGGSIINISSINSQLAFPKNPGYVSSKGGVTALTRALALDYNDKKIRVNSISPGYIREGMAKNSFKNKKANIDRVRRMIIKRWGKSEDLFGVIELLISNKSSYITGQEFIIDGGWTSKGL